jgi:hypothetical protein
LKRYVFRYAPESVGLETVNRPKIPVFLCSAKKEWHAFRVYVDSGADLSLFTRDDAELLGLNLKEGKFKPIIGIGRTLIPAYVHTVEMKIGDSSLKAETAFADSDEIPRLLGRRDIFTNFKITFCEKDLEIIFEEENR